MYKRQAGACQDNLVIFPTSPYEVLLFPSQRNCWRTEEWLNIVSEMERARGYGDWSFLDAFYLYDRIEDTIKPVSYTHLDVYKSQWICSRKAGCL